MDLSINLSHTRTANEVLIPQAKIYRGSTNAFPRTLMSNVMFNDFPQVPLSIDYDPSKDENKELIPFKKMAGKDVSSRIQKILRTVKKLLARVLGIRKKKKTRRAVVSMGDESLDWWSKYFASLEVSRQKGIRQADDPIFVIYHRSRSETRRFQEERSRQLGSILPEDRKLAGTFKVSHVLAYFHQISCLIGRKTGVRWRTGDAAAVRRFPGWSQSFRVMEGTESRESRLRQRQLCWKVQGLA